MAKKYRRKTHISVRKKREEEQKLAKRQEFYHTHKKQLICGALAAVALAVVICLAVDFFYCPGGSMRIFLGNLMGAENTDIIRNLGTQKKPRYYKFGSFEAPEGFTLDADSGLPGSDGEQNFYYISDSEDSVIGEIYVTGVTERTAEEMLDIVATNSTVAETDGMYTFMSEKSAANIGGHDVKYIYIQGRPSSSIPDVYHSGLLMYVDTIQGSSVLVNVFSQRLSQDELPTEEALLAASEEIMALLTVPAV